MYIFASTAACTHVSSWLKHSARGNKEKEEKDVIKGDDF